MKLGMLGMWHTHAEGIVRRVAEHPDEFTLARGKRPDLDLFWVGGLAAPRASQLAQHTGNQKAIRPYLAGMHFGDSFEENLCSFFLEHQAHGAQANGTAVVTACTFNANVANNGGKTGSGGGINILITDRAQFEPLRTGFEIAAALRKLYSDKWEAKGYERLLGNEKALQALLDGKPAMELEAVSREGVPEFLRRRARVLIYE